MGETCREKVLYLYGVVPIGQSVPSTFANDSLETVSHATLTAIVEPVLAADFSGEALENHLKSIEWVARLARKHERIVVAAMRGGSVIPARLCTLFSNREAVQRTLATNEERFVKTLKRLDGRGEWSFKAFCDERCLEKDVAAGSPEIHADDAAIKTAGPGRAFVLRKKREAHLAKAVEARLNEIVDETTRMLEEVSDDLRLRPLLQPETTGRDEPMVLNAAALVKNGARKAFHDALLKIAIRFDRQGLLFESSGPYAAYSFCETDGGHHGE